MIGGIGKGFEKLLMEEKVAEEGLRAEWAWGIEWKETGIDDLESGKGHE